MKNCTIIKNYQTKKVIIKNGNCSERYSPCSTFKLAIALMGYDQNVLVNENEPLIKYEPEIHRKAFIKSQKQNQTPASWLKNSCVWYSEEILPKIGKQNLKQYLKMFDYGNQDMSNKKFWLNSSLKISPEEQINFIENILSHKFKISEKSYEMLKNIIPVIKQNGWKIYGKTGTAFHSEKKQSGWFVGWAEKESKRIMFVKHFSKMDIDFDGKTFASYLAREEIINDLKKLEGENENRI